MRAYTPWSLKERQLLQRDYVEQGATACAEALGRSRSSVKAYAIRMGLRRSGPTKGGRKRPVKFTAKEIAYLKEHYADKGPEHCALQWNRPRKSVVAKANKLGLFYHMKRGDGIAVGTITLRIAHGVKHKFIKLSPDHPLYGNRGAWCKLRLYNWHEAYGAVADGYRVVFRDGDRMNCELANLKILSLSEHTARAVARVPKAVQRRAGRKGWASRERNLRKRLGLKPAAL
ncbi:hypothetical protein LEM8419_03494 [Neolewinella maritima]|uniref:HNH nuclease domain-containing protein n=1 Tax=Neolewinella maritima TaxID=1383882 RepID=A0ABN8F6N9_9BACT|nr:HNH endonuclease [Neolewinella maritima]CAH1002622.1 hypothetical protein LEM8419_03494 [Neolewinella maritima]